jgi:hypothetical protein
MLIVTSSVAVARIYIEDPSRITTSQNQLGLSLSKRIRHGLVAKINDKRSSWTYEALGWILADYSRACRAPASIASPHHAMPGEVRRVSTRVYFSLSSLLHTLVSA